MPPASAGCTGAVVLIIPGLGLEGSMGDGEMLWCWALWRRDFMFDRLLELTGVSDTPASMGDIEERGLGPWSDRAITRRDDDAESRGGSRRKTGLPQRHQLLGVEERDPHRGKRAESEVVCKLQPCWPLKLWSSQ